MTHDQALAYNRAIDDAVKAYPKGIGCIESLRIKKIVTVEHIGRSTKQDVVDVSYTD